MTEPALASRDESLTCGPEPLASSSDSSFSSAPPFTPAPVSSSSSASTFEYSGDAPAYLGYTPAFGSDADAMACVAPPPGSTPPAVAPAPPPDRPPPRAERPGTVPDRPATQGDAGAPGPAGPGSTGGSSPAARADAPSAATSGAAARRTGGHAAQSGGGRANAADAAQRRQRDLTLRRLVLPASQAARGVARIGREPLFLAVPSRTWSAPRTLEAPLPEPQSKRNPQNPGPPQAESDPAEARRLYTAAAGQAEALFDRILAAAARLAREADSQLQTLTDRTESQLGRALVRLEEDHAQRLVDAARSRDSVLERIATRSDILRFYVVEQANGALGRMSSLRQELLTLVDTLRRPVLDAQGALGTAISGASSAHAGAQRKLRELKDQTDRRDAFRRSGKFPTNQQRGPAMVAAMLEAANHYAGPRIDADIKALNDRWLTVRNFAEPIAACGPCEADGKLIGLRNHAESLGVAGPRAIRSARDGALNSIDETEQQLNLSVVEAHRQTEDGLVRNHDQTRQMLVAQSAQAALGLRRDIERTGRQQVEALTGVAATQPAAVAMVDREVGKAARATPTRAAALAVQSIARLRRNIANVSERHPSGVLGMADRNRAGRMDRATAGGREMLSMVAGFAEQQRKFIGEAFATVGQSIDQTLFDMAGVPGQVGASCDSMIAAARAAVTAARNDIPPQMAFIAQKLTDACDGLIPISPDSPPANSGGAASHGAGPAEPLMCTPADEPNMSVFDPGAMSPPMSSSMSSSSSPMMSVAPVASSGGAGSSESSGTGTGSGGGGGTPAPSPASCSPCETARTAARDRARAAAPPAAAPDGNVSSSAATDAATTSDAGDDVGVSSDRTNQRSPNAYREHADPIGRAAVRAPEVDAFLDQVVGAVEGKLGSQVSTAYTALKQNEATDYPSLMNALRGMTPVQGAALSEAYLLQKHRNLAQQIRAHAYFGWGTRFTKESNRDAALAALEGNISGAALNELEAAFNWTNETDRIFSIMQSMSQDQMRSFVEAHRGRLNELMEQLSDADRARFQLLMDGDTVRARSTELKNNVDAVNRRHASARASDDRGFALNDVIGQAEQAPRWALEGPSDRADIYGLEDPTVRQQREAAHWAEIQRDFGRLDGVADAIMRDNPQAAVSRPDDPPGAMLLAYATRPLTLYTVYPPQQREGETREDALARQRREYQERWGVTIEERSGPQGAYRVATTSMNEYQLHALEQTIRHGARSREARSARALAQFRRSDGRPPDYRDVEAQLHSGLADAREGGNFEHGSREAADRDRLETFRMMEQHRRQIEGGASGPISGEDARASFREEMARAYRDRPQDLDVALGVIDSDEGNMQAVIDQAIAREDPALLNRYLGRMDSRQIEAMVTEWNRRHPNGPGLRERLGVGRSNHWSITNMNGAVFTGDEANTLEIAMMGVPQNPQQKAEVALRIVDQQIEQAGWMGRLLCSDEYDKLVEHANHLHETMGVTEGDIDEQGRIRLRTRDGQVFYGNFDRNGQFRPSAASGSSTALNMLSAGSRIVADNYANAVDRMASMLTTIIAVVGAIILTVATFGAGASVLVAMAIAAGIGALTIGVNASMRGGRYSRDDLTRDAVSAAVQIATAGLNVGIARGLAAGAKLAQGAAVAARGLTLSQRLAVTASRHALATGMLTQGAMGGMSNLASTALDPAMRRREDYGDQVMHSFFRGFAGGAVTAGAAHGLNASASRLVQRFAVNRALNQAIAQGASRAAAIERAAEAAAKASSGRIMDYGVRALVGGTSATAGRATEMGYENVAGLRQHGAGDFYRELRHAFIQNAIQGIGEGGALRYTRTRVASHVARQAELTAGERDAAARAAGEAFDREMARRGITPEPPESAPGARPPTAPRPSDEDEGRAVRTDDEDGRRPPAAANDDEGAAAEAAVRTRVALAEGEMLRMGRVGTGSVFIHPDSTNVHAANDNFGRLVNADPTREVAVYHNPVTGEYLVIQGDARSVAMIRHDGEIKGPGISGFPAAALAQRGGHWELRTHFHPNRPGQAHTNMARRLPSGQNGDLGVVEAEARHIARLSADGVAERNSRIYFVDEGKLRYTDFSVRVDGDNVTYRVSFPDPATGTHGEPKVFTDIAAYHAFFEQQTGIRYPVTPRRGARGRTADSPPEAPLEPTRRVGGETATLDDALTQQNRSDAEFVAQRMAQAESFEAARLAGRAHESGIDPLLGRLASTSDAHAWVTRMGLIDRPDSMRRLAAIVNDPVLSDRAKEQVLVAVREATREALIRRGALEPHEPLLLTLHGAPATRAASISRSGINLSLLAGGATDDFSLALYFTTQLSNAKVYAARGEGNGRIFPGILRGRDMGMDVGPQGTRPGSVIDVTPQGAHRAQWEAFVRANMHLLGRAEGMVTPEHGMRMMDLTMEIGRQVFAENPANAGRTPTPRELFKLGSDNFYARAPFTDLDRVGQRGTLFEAFLRHMAETSGDPRLGSPLVVLGELGGVLTSGIGRGDQQAIRSQRVADLLNEQLGVGGRTAPRAGGDDDLRVRAVDEPGSTDAARRRGAEEREFDQQIERAFRQMQSDAEASGVTAERPGQPAAILPEGWRLINNAIAAAARGDSTEAVQLRQLLNDAPEATRRILHEIATESLAGRRRTLTNDDVFAIEAELIIRRGMSRADARAVARNIAMVASPATRLHQTLSEVPFTRGLTSSLRRPLEQATAERAGVRAAREFADRNSPTMERRELRRLLDVDTEGVVRMITGEGSWQSRALRFAWRRFRDGASWPVALREGFLAARILRSPTFATTQARWQQRASALTPRLLADMIRARPDVLHHLARTSPQQLSEWFADYVLRQPRSRPPVIDPDSFASYVQNRLISNVLPIVSEASSVWSNFRRLGLQLLKADAVQRGGANRPGLDLVGFSATPGSRPEAGDMVRVVIIDDKAYRGTDLENVSAMTELRLITNLRTTAAEIDAGVLALRRLGEHVDNPQIAEYIAGARAATRQMRNAASELAAITPPGTDMRSRPYLRRVAEILRRNNIVPLVSSEYGNVRNLAQWLRAQGFRLDDEYARILAEQLIADQRRRRMR